MGPGNGVFRKRPIIKPGCKVRIREMDERDLQAVLKIEKACFDVPWQEKDFRQCMQNGCKILVAERDEKVVANGKERVVGFIVYYSDLEAEIRVLDIAVTPYWHRHQVGTQMLTHLEGMLSPEGLGVITLEVRETNLRALLFFKALGLIAVGLLRNRYEETQEDAIRMCLSLWGDYQFDYTHHQVPAHTQFAPANRVAEHFPETEFQDYEQRGEGFG